MLVPPGRPTDTVRKPPSWRWNRWYSGVKPGLPPACWSLAGPQPNSCRPVSGWTEWYCQCRSPQTTNRLSSPCSRIQPRISFPSWAKVTFEWLSFLLARSGPTSGVGLSRTFQSASLARRLSLSHRFCSSPQIDLSGPVGHRVRRAEVAPLDEPDLEPLAPAEGPVEGVADGVLLVEDALPFGEGQREHLAGVLGGIAVVVVGVVVVLHEVARHAAGGTRRAWGSRTCAASGSAPGGCVVARGSSESR